MSRFSQSAAMGPSGRAVLRRFFDGRMTPDECVQAMANYDRMYPTRIIAAGDVIRPLPRRAEAFAEIALEHEGRAFDLYDYLATNRVAGLLVLKDGQVAYETYQLGIGPDTLWASCSLAKSIASTLVGAAVRDGAIASLDDPLTRYVPQLAGGAYEGVSVRHLLGMTSGVAWNEAYTDPGSDRRRLLEVQFELQPGGIVAFMSRLPRAAPPGTVCVYNTGESYLFGLLMQNATGMHLTDYLSRKLWAPLGMEQDATWWTEGEGGIALAGSGISATLRDYGRFGQFVLDDGCIDGRPVTPDGWFEAAGAPQDLDGQVAPYGYMWWIPVLQDPMLKGSFQAEGIYGQYIHVNPRERLVVVMLCARPKPSFVARLEFNDDAFFAAVARALA